MQTDEHVGLSMQEVALAKIKAGHNVFVTGGAGVGKTFVINQLKDDKTLLLAPTGIAALNIGGMTVSRAFKIPTGPVKLKDYKAHAPLRKMFKSGDVTRVLIDEAGMLEAQSLDLIDSKLRHCTGVEAPFGGVQVVLVGDMYQLAPIPNKYPYERYNTPYCFGARSWKFETVALTKVYRQEDTRQQAILSSIRSGDRNSGRALSVIQAEARKYDPTQEQTHLCCYKVDAARQNKVKFNQLDGLATNYRGVRSNLKDTWKDCTVEVDLSLKLGAKVVIKTNDPEGEWVNGDTGHVSMMGKDFVSIKLLRGGVVVNIPPYTWERTQIGADGSEEVIGTFTQIPVVLGYAITGHSSQGMTLENVAIDVGDRGCFSCGQLYVLLSRVKDLRNLSFIRTISKRDLKVSNDVKLFYDNL